MTGVTLYLTSDEAVVLFELLQRWDHAEAIDPNLLTGEPAALRNLLAALERVLVEPFDPSYVEILERARQRLSEASGE